MVVGLADEEAVHAQKPLHISHRLQNMGPVQEVCSWGVIGQYCYSRPFPATTMMDLPLVPTTLNLPVVGGVPHEDAHACDTGYPHSQCL